MNDWTIHLFHFHFYVKLTRTTLLNGGIKIKINLFQTEGNVEKLKLLFLCRLCGPVYKINVILIFSPSLFRKAFERLIIHHTQLHMEVFGLLVTSSKKHELGEWHNGDSTWLSLDLYLDSLFLFIDVEASITKARMSCQSFWFNTPPLFAPFGWDVQIPCKWDVKIGHIVSRID